MERKQTHLNESVSFHAIIPKYLSFICSCFIDIENALMFSLAKWIFLLKVLLLRHLQNIDIIVLPLQPSLCVDKELEALRIVQNSVSNLHEFYMQLSSSVKYHNQDRLQYYCANLQ